MRVINVSDNPYIFTWDSGSYGPILPGEVREFPDEIGSHGVNASLLLDDIGQPTGVYRLLPVNAVKGSKEYEAMVKYPCGICGDEGGFFGKADLERHMMEKHFSRPAPQPQAPPAERGAATSTARPAQR